MEQMGFMKSPTNEDELWMEQVRSGARLPQAVLMVLLATPGATDDKRNLVSSEDAYTETEPTFRDTEARPGD